MTPLTSLTCAEQLMQQRWQDLIIAERQGATIAELEHLYNAYLRAVNDYNRLVVTPQIQVDVPPDSSAGKKTASHPERRAS